MNEFEVLYGYFCQNGPMVSAISIIGSIFILLFLGYFSAPLLIWTLFLFAMGVGFGCSQTCLLIFLGVALVFNIPPFRTLLVSSPLLALLRKLEFMPKISETERTALEAGVVWVEGALFSGKPNFHKLQGQSFGKLTAEEQAYIDGPIQRICDMANEWEIWKQKEIPKELFDLMKKEKIFGMIIPKNYGGLGFSALAHSQVIMKLSSRSIPVTITSMVPNSLGPAELLTHYGTEKQKNHYLPRLADGRDIPCFALTEPQAGSDAGAIQAEGVLFKGDDGKIYVRLNWNKRWITLAAISTVLGLAFRLKDPDEILGKGKDLGITCALIPSTTPGVILGRRHDPLGVPFYNCPTQGKDVVVDAADVIIGGLENAGKGWGMLMDSLAAGRGISLPSQAVGGMKLASLVTSAHATVRKQFGMSIGKFEGIEEPLARIAAFTYLSDAMRKLTLFALDQGVKPPVVTAIAKYQSTELGRRAINDAMDVLGGAGISKGPRNTIANLYISTPIGITVEGANILTRTLIIFGQGALRAHPWAYKEFKAIEENNAKNFDNAFWGHIGHVISNICRSFLLSVTRGHLMRAPGRGEVARSYQKLAWASASFAILADIAMGTLGGKLKAKQKLTGRFADILSWLYIGFATVRRYELEGSKQEDLPLFRYSMQHAFSEMQKAFDGILSNITVPGLTWFFRGIISPWCRFNSIGVEISDDLSHEVADAMLNNENVRADFKEGIYVPKDLNMQVGRLENAYRVARESEASERKIKKAIRKKILPKKRVGLLIDEALEKNIINSEEAKTLKSSESILLDAIQVDSFSQDEYLGKV